MKTMQQLFESALAKAAFEGMDPSRFDEIASNTIKEMLPTLASEVIAQLRATAPAMLKHYRGEWGGFGRRIKRRWGKAIDQLEIVWATCWETGAKFNATHRPKAAQSSDYRFEALTHLHARGLLTAREIICLVEGGFPDGALSRWRTLHEIAVTAQFLKQEDVKISYRYLASFHHNARNAALQHNRHASRMNLEPFTPKELALLEKRVKEFGGPGGLKKYDWALPALPPGRPPTFEAVEFATKMHRWRPYYTWSSQPVHAAFRPARNSASESPKPILLAGPSDSGHVNPLQLTALSLASLHSALFSIDPTFDDLVAIKVVAELSKEVGPFAVKLERKRLQRKVRAKQTRPAKTVAKNRSTPGR